LELHPLAANFAGVADAYERGRYDYEPAVIGALAAELRLSPGDRVLDLAAGTGKLTRILVDWGLDVTAVEPHQAMRERLAAHIEGERILEGFAEAIPLPDRSVSAVTVGDGFHWFDSAVALEEIRRVLEPGGGLAILATLPDWTGASWADEIGAMMERLRPEHPYFDGPSWQDAVRTAGGWSEPRQIRVTTPQSARPERMVDFLNSMSWVAAMPEDQREETLAEITALVDSGETPAEIDVHVIIGLAKLL
jgi:ubiquinone/menaquinone biosynthesis C-methylase UbiE